MALDLQSVHSFDSLLLRRFNQFLRDETQSMRCVGFLSWISELEKATDESQPMQPVGILSWNPAIERADERFMQMLATCSDDDLGILVGEVMEIIHYLISDELPFPMERSSLVWFPHLHKLFWDREMKSKKEALEYLTEYAEEVGNWVMMGVRADVRHRSFADAVAGLPPPPPPPPPRFPSRKLTWLHLRRATSLELPPRRKVRFRCVCLRDAPFTEEEWIQFFEERFSLKASVESLYTCPHEFSPQRMEHNARITLMGLSDMVISRLHHTHHHDKTLVFIWHLPERSASLFVTGPTEQQMFLARNSIRSKFSGWFGPTSLKRIYFRGRVARVIFFSPVSVRQILTGAAPLDIEIDGHRYTLTAS